MRRLTPLLAVLFAVAVVAASCGKSDNASANASTTSGPIDLRLGYFPNITHAPALVGVERGLLAAAMGKNVTLKTATFNAGPAAVEALFAGAIDATFIGPSPAVNAYTKSNGTAIKIVAGATSGGAELVVRPDISSAAELKGKTVASPQLGNTQDVALRAWLKSQGLSTDKAGGGDVKVAPQDNAQTLDTFKAGAIQGAWVPEPWGTRLVQEGGGKVLVNEKDLWPGGKFSTTLLVVRTDFLRKHADVVSNLLKGLLDSIDYINQHPADAQSAANDGIRKITSKALTTSVLTGSWANMTFTVDPVASSVAKSANDAADLGLIAKPNLAGIFDLTLLNKLLRAEGKPAVKADV